MDVYSSKAKNSRKSLIFIHGWGGNQHSLECIKKQFETKFDCYLLCLSGFGSFPLEKSYKIENYLGEIDSFIKDYNINNVVIIGHSFGGKLALMLKLIHPEYEVIALAPSIVKNPFSLKIYLRIKLYKLLKRFHITIPKHLRGSRDYQNTQGYLKSTFLLVHHSYLNKNQLKKLEKCLIIGFKEDQEVKYKSLKKLPQINHKIKLIMLTGNHFAYYETILDIYHIINGFIRSDN